MKKIFSLLLFIFMSVLLIGQAHLDTLFAERTMLFNQYSAHKDTMTVNTWMNIFRLNKYLQQLVACDSLIINELKSGTNGQNDELAIAQSKLENLINEKKDLNRRLSELQSTQEISGNNVKITAMAGGIATVLLVTLLVLYILSLNKQKRNSQLVKEYHTDLYNAKAEIEQMQNDEMRMAGEINSRLKRFEDEKVKINEKLSLLSDEKVMLENQMIEMKKAYDREVEKRIIAEDQLHSLELKENERMESELSDKPTVDNQFFAETIHHLQTDLEKEKTLRLSIENELGKLLDRLKGHYS